MSEPVLARNWQYSYWGKTRVYDVPGFDDPFPSVTSVIGMKDKPALVQWAANCAAEYATDHRDALIELDPEGAVAAIKRSWRTQRDRAANYGTMIHELIENGQKPLPGTKERGFIDQADLMLRTFEVTGQEVTLINPKLQYAGTVDALALNKGGDACIIDWKTGGLYESAAMQLVALMDCTHFIEDGELIELERMNEIGYAVQLSEDSHRVENIVRTSPLGVDTMRAFEGLLPVWNYTTQHGEYPWEEGK